jgi:hypothetical protein
MSDKEKILSDLDEIFTVWQALLSSLSEEQVLQPLLPSAWTVKDVIAHLWSWQQASVARAEAALQGQEPGYPEWWKVCGPDPNEDVDQTNAYLYKANRDKPWSKVYSDWKTQFQQYLDLTRQIPDSDLLEIGKYLWMGSFALAASATGSWEHHQEHYESLIAWLNQ